MLKTSHVVNNILKKIENEYIEIEEQRKKNHENQKSKKIQKNIIDRHSYIQNIEKKLNEIVAHSLEIKKPEKKINFSASSRNINIDTQKSNEIYKKPNTKETKTRICRLFFITGMCRWGENCKMAHNLKNIGIEYQPKLWVSHFSNKTIPNFFLNDNDIFQSSKLKPENINKNIVNSIDKIINKKGRTKLMEAVINSDYESIKFLLAQGANAGKQDWNGIDSLMHALRKNDTEGLCLCLDLCKIYINLNIRFFSSKSTYLIIAAQNGQSKIVKCLLYHKADPNICDLNSRSALIYSIKKNDFESVQALVTEGININIIDDDEKSALDIAYESLKIDIVEFLFLKGASMSDNTKHKNLLFLACEYNRRNLINEVIKRGVLTNELTYDGKNVLIISFENGHDNLCIELIEEFTLSHLINQKTKNGDNVFILSAKHGNSHLFKYFLTKSVVDLNFQDKNGKTALMYCSEIGDDSLVSLLLEKGANPNISDKFNETALIIASKHNHILCVENILNQKDINVKWRDDLNMNARNHAQNDDLKKMITYYMLDNDKISDSLYEEMDQMKNFNSNDKYKKEKVFSKTQNSFKIKTKSSKLI